MSAVATVLAAIGRIDLVIEAIARAWVSRPRLLLLDEPTSGLDDNEVAALERSLQRVRHEVSMVVIAHHLDFVMRLADTVTVLDFGRVIASGMPEAVRNDPQVVAAYVGAAEDQDRDTSAACGPPIMNPR
jgi:branched-chain amino acid transport system ATP-binding protein